MRRIRGPKLTLGNIEKRLRSPTAHPEAVKTSDRGRSEPVLAPDFHLASMLSRRTFCVSSFLVIRPTSASRPPTKRPVPRTGVGDMNRRIAPGVFAEAFS